jgi:hypothetical protein
MGIVLVGYEVDPSFKEYFASTVLEAGVVIAGAIAVWGRIVATKTLVTKPEGEVT